MIVPSLSDIVHRSTQSTLLSSPSLPLTRSIHLNHRPTTRLFTALLSCVLVLLCPLHCHRLCHWGCSCVKRAVRCRLAHKKGSECIGVSYESVACLRVSHHGGQSRSHSEGVQGGSRGERQQRSDGRPRRQSVHSLEGKHQGTSQTINHIDKQHRRCTHQCTRPVHTVTTDSLHLPLSLFH